jgi:hypothetical protein
MKIVRPCSFCAGPVTIKMARCPHCQKRNPIGLVVRGVGGIAALVGGFSVSSTLAACYGGPCAMPNDQDCPTSYVPTCSETSKQPAIDDADKDGYCGAYDCNENDPKINRNAKDPPGDGIDQDCDGHD